MSFYKKLTCIIKKRLLLMFYKISGPPRVLNFNPPSSAELYAEIISGIRSFSKDLVICVSLSGRHLTEYDQRAEPLQLEGDLKPDMASLTLSSLNFNRVASMNSP